MTTETETTGQTTRLVRARGGRMIHLRQCRFATNAAPWNWAEGLDGPFIYDAIRRVGGIDWCRHCKPLGDWS